MLSIAQSKIFSLSDGCGVESSYYISDSISFTIIFVLPNGETFRMFEFGAIFSIEPTYVKAKEAMIEKQFNGLMIKGLLV